MDFLSMLQSVDALFPIGAFTLSNGLESYVRMNDIKNIEQAEEYLTDMIKFLPFNDLGLLYLSFQNHDKKDKIQELDRICGAIKIAAEVRKGSNKTGIRFMKMQETLGKSKSLALYQNMVVNHEADGYYPIALGLFASDKKMDLDLLLCMYSYSILSSSVNTLVKLVPLSQMKGQVMLSRCLEKIEDALETVKQITKEDLGISGTANVIRCMQHETLYSREYMS